MMRDMILLLLPPLSSSSSSLSDLDLGVAVNEIVGGDLEVERSRALTDTRRCVVV
jgi:hypothetical protein